MSVYTYKAKDKAGNSIIGAVEAPSEVVATDMLKDKELIVVSLAERRKTTLLQTSLPFFNRVKMRDVVVFARQLAVMMTASVPIVQGLRILTRQTENVTFKIIISEIADEVDGGAKFSAALARYPQVFSNFYINMVRSGETTGRLDETLNYLADQQEKDYDLQSKIRGALIYPVFVVSGMLVMGIGMMIFVIPKLVDILRETGATLPFTTKMLIWVSNFLVKDWWLVLAIIIIFFMLFRTVTRSAAGRERFDTFKLRMPIFGAVYRKVYITRLSRSMSTLLGSGVPLPQSLEIVADVVGNAVYKNLTLKTIKEVEDGNPLSTTFGQSPLVPPMLAQMMNVGEQTGRLDYVLGKLADFFAKEVENGVTSLVTLIEPIILIVLGVGVGLLVSAILLPIYSATTSI